MGLPRQKRKPFLLFVIVWKRTGKNYGRTGASFGGGAKTTTRSSLMSYLYLLETSCPLSWFPRAAIALLGWFHPWQGVPRGHALQPATKAPEVRGRCLTLLPLSLDTSGQRLNSRIPKGLFLGLIPTAARLAPSPPRMDLCRPVPVRSLLGSESSKNDAELPVAAAGPEWPPVNSVWPIKRGCWENKATRLRTSGISESIQRGAQAVNTSTVSRAQRSVSAPSYKGKNSRAGRAAGQPARAPSPL